MVRDHQLQEQPVEVRALERRQLSHLLRARHARHLVVRVHSMMRRRVRHVLAALTQPPLHELDLILLRRVDAPGRVEYCLPVGAIGDQR